MTEMINTSRILDRGWARAWLEPLLGEPSKQRGAKLWSLDDVIRMEADPVFLAACEALRELLKMAKYQTADVERAALSMASRKAGQEERATQRVDRPNLTPRSGGQHVWREQVAGGIALHFAGGPAIIVPQPFLDALQLALGATAERFAMGIDLVISDLNAQRFMPKNPAHGRALFIGAIRYQLGTLAAMEAEASGTVIH